jgi:hypothetical protein
MSDQPQNLRALATCVTVWSGRPRETQKLLIRERSKNHWRGRTGAPSSAGLRRPPSNPLGLRLERRVVHDKPEALPA